jgi:hypothetical protein
MKQEILTRLKELGGNIDAAEGGSLHEDLLAVTFDTVLYADFEDEDGVFFSFGIAPYWKIDVYGNTTVISEMQAKKIHKFVQLGSFHMKIIIDFKQGRISEENRKDLEILLGDLNLEI